MGSRVRAELTAAVLERPVGIAPLIRAGVLECALHDAGVVGAQRSRAITDAVADGVLGDREALGRAHTALGRIELPETLTLKRPEGYAFYALDPRSYAQLADTVPCSRVAVVIGLRSIGTSLSAIVRAALARRGIPAYRFTVRPTGHPWDRRLTWSAEEDALLTRLGANADYFVVDEGPGLSGSTFLAVAEALVARGIEADRVQLLCSHEPQPERLVAPDAAQRWRRFACRAAQSFRPPLGSFDLSWGSWRAQRYDHPEEWPASWQTLERPKYLTADRRHLVKFEGYPPYCASAFDAARCLADGGWGPSVLAAEPGFLGSRWIDGARPATADRDAVDALPHLVRYIAFRSSEFRRASAAGAALEHMTRVNVAEETGFELPSSFCLEAPSPVLADARMMPHEWLVTGSGFIKTDALDHGDDHLYPGPTDIAWDVAGTIVEWDLDDGAVTRFLGDLANALGQSVQPRLNEYLLAYCAFRLGVTRFAVDAADEYERKRWGPLQERYRRRLNAALSELSGAPPRREELQRASTKDAALTGL